MNQSTELDLTQQRVSQRSLDILLTFIHCHCIAVFYPLTFWFIVKLFFFVSDFSLIIDFYIYIYNFSLHIMERKSSLYFQFEKEGGREGGGS